MPNDDTEIDRFLAAIRGILVGAGGRCMVLTPDILDQLRLRITTEVYGCIMIEKVRLDG